jgi:DUF1680 family protein
VLTTYQYDLNGEYADIMELSLYNAVLTAMSYDGTSFTYINQLASSDQDLSKREEWFTCACCPPNVLRLLGQIGGYVWSYKLRDQAVEIAVHLYISSTLELNQDGVQLLLTQESAYPWKGEIKFDLQTSQNVTLRLRLPKWAGSHWKVCM